MRHRGRGIKAAVAQGAGPRRDVAVVEVEEFDCRLRRHTRPRTGASAIVVQAWERYKGGTRVSFACGGRAARSSESTRHRGRGGPAALDSAERAVLSRHAPAGRSSRAAPGVAGAENNWPARGGPPQRPRRSRDRLARVVEGRDAAALKSWLSRSPRGQAISSRSRRSRPGRRRGRASEQAGRSRGRESADRAVRRQGRRTSRRGPGGGPGGRRRGDLCS